MTEGEDTGDECAKKCAKNCTRHCCHQVVVLVCTPCVIRKFRQSVTRASLQQCGNSNGGEGAFADRPQWACLCRFTANCAPTLAPSRGRRSRQVLLLGGRLWVRGCKKIKNFHQKQITLQAETSKKRREPPFGRRSGRGLGCFRYVALHLCGASATGVLPSQRGSFSQGL